MGAKTGFGWGNMDNIYGWKHGEKLFFIGLDKWWQAGVKNSFAWADMDDIHGGKVDEKNCFVQREHKTSLGIVYVATDI